MTLSKEIERHYREGREAQRLASGRGELERLRTQAILARYLPAPPAVVLDVGGAAGVYAIPLAAQGYQVHLTDPVELHIEQARKAAREAVVSLASAEIGDARRLDRGDASADAVLLLGPLYHLVEREDRLTALREARRVLKPGGVLFAAAISRFASLIDGVAGGVFSDIAFQKIIAGDLASGRHENPTHHPNYFTTAYFHRPEELGEEVSEAGFGAVEVLALEGPVWSASGFDALWADEAQQRKLLEFLQTIEREPSVQGASAHFIAVGKRPA